MKTMEDVQVVIHRGAHEIGGSCVEVRCGKDRLILDMGLPLGSPGGDDGGEAPEDQAVLPPFRNPEGWNTAVLFSHAHRDHAGLLFQAAGGESDWDGSAALFMGKGTQKLLEISRLFSGGTALPAAPQNFETGRSFSWGAFSVTPYLMDHSAFDAYAFLVEAAGRRLLYSGDFRDHGRKAGVFRWFTHQIAGSVDYLILEGTTLGPPAALVTSPESGRRRYTETDVEDKAARIMGETEGPVLVYTAGQNIDRLVSFYRAARRSGRILAADFYTAHVLTELHSPAKIPYPSEKYPDLKVWFPRKLSRRIAEDAGRPDILRRYGGPWKITKEEMTARPDRLVLLVRPGMEPDLERIGGLENGIFFYSLWQGYKANPRTAQFLEYLHSRGLREVPLHSSGHAGPQALKQMVDAVQPLNIIPIHTQNPDAYREVFLGSTILPLPDGETLTLT